MNISHDRRLFQLGAASSAALAVTTFLLWFLPQLVPPAEGFVAQRTLADNPWYMAKLWVNFFHMWLGLAALLAAAALLARRQPGWAWLGFAFFAIWVVVELIGVSVNLFGVNMTWRAGYAAADAERQAVYRTLILGFPGVWEGLYFTLGSAYLAGCAIFAAIALADPARGWTRIAGVMFAVGGALSLAFLVSGYNGPAWPGEIGGAAYPVVQPAARLAIGVWLWKAAKAIPAGS